MAHEQHHRARRCAGPRSAGVTRPSHRGCSTVESRRADARSIARAQLDDVRRPRAHASPRLRVRGAASLPSAGRSAAQRGVEPAAMIEAVVRQHDAVERSHAERPHPLHDATVGRPGVDEDRGPRSASSVASPWPMSSTAIRTCPAATGAIAAPRAPAGTADRQRASQTDQQAARPRATTPAADGAPSSPGSRGTTTPREREQRQTITSDPGR